MKEIGDRDSEGKTYGNIGIAYYDLGDFKKAITYHERKLEIMKELGNRGGEGHAYGELGIAYERLGDFKKAIHFLERCLEITITEVGDRVSKGNICSNLGMAYCSVGDFKKAMHYLEPCSLEIAKDEGDKTGEMSAYGNLGNVYFTLDDFHKATSFYELSLKLCKELGEKAGEGRAYLNLGNAYCALQDFEKAIDCYERRLKIVKELGDRAGEGSTYGNLGNILNFLGDSKKAKCYLESALQIAKEVGDKVCEAKSYCSLGWTFASLGSVEQAVDCHQSSVRTLNEVRLRLQFKDEWKISLRHMYQTSYTNLWRLLLRQGKTVEALFAAEQGRAQALNDLIELKYGFSTSNVESRTAEESIFDMLRCVPSSIVFTAADRMEIVFWVGQKGRDVNLRRKDLPSCKSTDDVTTFFQSLILSVREEIGVRSGIKCEDRSLDKMRGEKQLENERSPKTRTHSSQGQTNTLQTLYEVIFSPIADLVHGNELIIVPEGPLCLAPFAAFMDSNSKYLCESFRIRVVPSLSSLKMIADCPAGYHRKTGALLVGDPWMQEVIIDNQGNKLQQLPCAREEVELIGRILKTAPLIGRDATKNEVLLRLSSVALVHIAAHGRMETGEIALAPNPERPNRQPREKDYMLTMADVMNIQLRARLVVLSCCHSGRGEIKAEGVVGIARAFLGAGARSVLVSLWAINDEATMEFMKSFYQHLVNGRSASESLNRAMNSMRESDKFNEVKYWAPFVLLGDDVTLESNGSE